MLDRSPRGLPLDDAVRRVAGAAGQDPHISHRVNDFEVVAALLKASAHVAPLPRWMSRGYPGDDIRLAAIEGDFGLTRGVDVLARPKVLERYGVPDVVSRLQASARSLRLLHQGSEGPGSMASWVAK